LPADWTTREWQVACLGDLHAARAAGEIHGVVCAAPGAGKTDLALLYYRQLHEDGIVDGLAVYSPSTTIRDEWRTKAARLGIQLSTGFGDRATPLPDRFHGYSVTYGLAVARAVGARSSESAAAFHAREVRRRRMLVVKDEGHHLAIAADPGERRAWGEALTLIDAAAPVTLLLTGTPWRHDHARIPNVRYDADGLVHRHYTLSYDDALDMGVIRPNAVHLVDGDVAWFDGEEHFSTLVSVAATEEERARALRTALDPRGEFLAHLLRHAWQMTEGLRRTDPAAALLVIGKDHDHATALQQIFLAVNGLYAPVVTCGRTNEHLAAAHERIRQFKAPNNTEPVLIAVKLISEGVDIPRLRVLAYCTNVMTAGAIVQAGGRVERRRAGEARKIGAYTYAPATDEWREYGTERARALERYALREEARAQRERQEGDADGHADTQAGGGYAFDRAEPVAADTIIGGRAYTPEEYAPVEAYVRAFRTDPDVIPDLVRFAAYQRTGAPAQQTEQPPNADTRRSATSAIAEPSLEEREDAARLEEDGLIPQVVRAKLASMGLAEGSSRQAGRVKRAVYTYLCRESNVSRSQRPTLAQYRYRAALLRGLLSGEEDLDHVEVERT
jgi:superfamily II DNA or RNA helicase